jgi:hypothetical protein
VRLLQLIKKRPSNRNDVTVTALLLGWAQDTRSYRPIHNLPLKPHSPYLHSQCSALKSRFFQIFSTKRSERFNSFMLTNSVLLQPEIRAVRNANSLPTELCRLHLQYVFKILLLGLTQKLGTQNQHHTERRRQIFSPALMEACSETAMIGSQPGIAELYNQGTTSIVAKPTAIFADYGLSQSEK